MIINLLTYIIVEIISIVILYALKGLEIPFIKQKISSEYKRNINDALEFIFKGIKLHEPVGNSL